eukprot:UN30579
MENMRNVDLSSMLVLSDIYVDENASFGPSKVNAFKKMITNLPVQNEQPLTPRTLNSNVEKRRTLPKFGKCKDQPSGQLESFVQKMPRIKAQWEPKFAKMIPATPKKIEIPPLKEFNVHGSSGSGEGALSPLSPQQMNVRRNKATKSPKTPTTTIVCRYCKGKGHFSMRCPNKVRGSFRDKPKRNVGGYYESILSEEPPRTAGPKKKNYRFDR